MPTRSRHENRPNSATHVDFGFTSATEFWHEVVLRARSRFLGHESRQHAVEAASAAWHLHEWVWHDKQLGGRASGADYVAFRDGLLNACPELAWMRDVADARKHQGLGRAEVKNDPRGAGRIAASLRIGVEDKNHDFADALNRVIGWWRTHHFPH